MEIGVDPNASRYEVANMKRVGSHVGNVNYILFNYYFFSPDSIFLLLP